MKRIFAIGGGEVGEYETLKIDEEIVKSSNKSTPKILFIPTASEESEAYISSFNKVYKDKLNCITDYLALIDGKTSSQEARKKILSSDIIYVGGGNTRMMMKVWKKHEVDKHLKDAYNKGIVLSGLSAGSICWFKEGQSDTEQFEAGNLDNYIMVDGIGLIDAACCPHYDEDKREVDFDKRVNKRIGIALDNNCAIEICDNKYKIHKSNINAKAYKVYKVGSSITREELININEYKDLSELVKT